MGIRRSTIYRSLRTFNLLHSTSKSLSQPSLKTALRGAEDGDLIILHIALQNSGLVIQKREEGYVAETFEASPRAADVLAAQGALEWDFPSRAVVIPPVAFESSSFQDSLAEFLEKASLGPVKQYAAIALKAGSQAYESRDTTSPAIIGQLLMAILEAVGRKHETILTRKRVRDEVCWSDGAENPWRRSATWLVIRVAIQRWLCSLFGSQGIFHYKFFMCFLMSYICNAFTKDESFPADRLPLVRAKLARRIAKLETQHRSGDSNVSGLLRSLFARHDRHFDNTLRAVKKRLEDDGSRLQVHDIRRMYRLPKRADHESTILSLHHSRDTLNRILTEVFYGQSPIQLKLPQRQSRVSRFSTWVNAQQSGHLSTMDYYCLADLELRLAKEVQEAMVFGPETHLEQTVLELRQNLRNYQSRARKAYKDNAEQSSLMVLTLMELWIVLDMVAVRLYPLLSDYDPGFPGNLMHCLKVAKLSDMHRLKYIEKYLEERQGNACYPLSAVLGDPSKNSFAVRYFDQDPDMQGLISEIWLANETSKSLKQEELAKESTDYEDLVRQASATACLYIQDDFNPSIRQHDDRRCTKHYLERKAARMRILIHEDLLPADDTHAKAVVFELLLPRGFAAWRDSTWQLLMLSRGDIITDKKPVLLLRDFSGLQSFKNRWVLFEVSAPPLSLCVLCETMG